MAEDMHADSRAVSALDPISAIVRRSMFWTPEREILSTWSEHVPFAFWLVDVLSPKVIVELGTYQGVSYSAMCQAVKTLNLGAACFAIDTWQGDDHSGLYPEDIYREFAAFHEPRYSAFSRLIRSTFEEALPHFEDGTVDLLHIDGFHTYEAVQRDFTSWLPKLSRNAIVLFHDTNVREGGFGVFRLWSEVTAGKAHFSFLHGHGLGVLGLGHQYPQALQFLFDRNAAERDVAAVRHVFASLGRSVFQTGVAVQREAELAARVAQIAALDRTLGERTGEIQRLESDLAALYASRLWRLASFWRGRRTSHSKNE